LIDEIYARNAHRSRILILFLFSRLILSALCCCFLAKSSAWLLLLLFYFLLGPAKKKIYTKNRRQTKTNE